MRTPRNDCRNMNHGKMNPPITFCPNCGESYNGGRATTRCDEEKHKARRKDRCQYCQDCGKDLNK